LGGGGIGSAIASGFADFGVDIALVDIDVDAMNAVKGELTRRFAKPADIVGSVIFFSCVASTYLTGHNLVVDGGYSVW